MVSVMVRIDKELAEPYRIRAEGEDRTLAAEIRQALRRDLQREESPQFDRDGRS